MKISLDCISEYVTLPKGLTAEEIAHAITLQTVEVEGYDDLAAALDKIVVGRIDKVERIEGSKNARVWLSAGTGRALEVVCGGSNVEAGKLVPVALPGALIFPRGKGEGLTVAAIERNGVKSEAVICAPNEIGLELLFPETGDTEILILPEGFAEPGTPLAGVIGWDDIILDVDNKSLTNRPDLWGHYGIAREIAACYGLELKPLAPEAKAVRSKADGKLVGSIDPAICSQFTILDIKTDGAAESPLWLKSRLCRLGQRPINLYTDLTNYVMLMVGQPCHAYDAGEVTAPFSVKRSDGKTPLKMIDGAELTIAGLPVVADTKGDLGVAGVMGGRQSAIGDTTRHIYWEAATFDPKVVRSAVGQMPRHDGTEASKRFEKGIDTQRVDLAIDLTAALVAQVDPSAEILSLSRHLGKDTQRVKTDVHLPSLRKRLGISLSTKKIVDTLTAFGFEVTEGKTSLKVTAPSWRSTGDISGPHDILEEVARGYGYDNFKATPVQVELATPIVSTRAKIERKIAEQLAFRGGLQQILTYPWAEKSFADVGAGDWDGDLKLADPPSDDAAHLRASLMPNMLRAIVENVKHAETFGLFEIGDVYGRTGGEKLPSSKSRLCVALYGRSATELLYQMFTLARELTVSTHMERLTWHKDEAGPAWLDAQSAMVIESGGAPAGKLGLLSNRVKRMIGLRAGNAAVLEIDLAAFRLLPSRTNAYRHFRSANEKPLDLSLVFRDDVPWAEIVGAVAGIDPLVGDISFVDEYRGKGVPDGFKSVTLRMAIEAEQGKLTKDQSTALVSKVAEKLKAALGATDRA